MTLAPGMRLGPFEVIGALGAGGMGEVYRARDTRLGRDVALKILPPGFAADSDRLMRFEREARTLAALNHPHIAQVYGVEESIGGDGAATRALVMELVEGEDLSQRIARGPLPLDEALAIARQIADALEAAHDQGIIHRDLKPANIKVREDGTVKVLDFGLAKAMESGVGNREPGVANTLANSPTITSPAMTQAGIILGTAAYMAPEQAKGKPATKRSDIWAFGCVLYEMLTGRRAFDGEDISDTLANVLKSEPDWSRLPSPTPPAVRRLLRRCLARDPKTRLADIADAQLELRDDTAAPASGWRSRRETLRQVVPIATICSVLAAGLTAAIARTWPAAAREPPTIVRFGVEAPPGWSLAAGLNPFGAVEIPFALSPDGQTLALLLRRDAGASRIFLRPVDALAPRELAGTEGAVGMFWSPDSRAIGFFADGKLKKVDVSGGAPVTICAAPSLNAATWGSAGTIVYAQSGLHGDALKQVPDTGGEPVAATRLENGEAIHIRPSFLPDGRHFLFRAAAGSGLRGGIFIASIDDQRRTPLIDAADVSSNVVYAAGHLVYARGTDLVAHPFDVNRLQLGSGARTIAEGVLTAINVGQFNASRSGSLAFLTGTEFPDTRELAWFDRTGTRLAALEQGRDSADVEVSVDGRFAALTRRSAPSLQRRDVWLLDLAHSLESRLTFDDAEERRPVWSPDGTRVVFGSNRKGRADLYIKARQGTAREEVLYADEQDKEPWSWSRDGKFLLYTSGGDRGDIWVLPLRDRKPFPLVHSAAPETDPQFSPDGRWVAYTATDAGTPQVFVTTFPDAANRWQISAGGGTKPRWSLDGKTIYYQSLANVVHAVAISTQASGFTSGDARPLFRIPGASPRGMTYSTLPDGRFLVNLAPESQKLEPITVVLNGLPVTR